MKQTKHILSLMILLCLSVNAFSQASIQKIKINGILEEWPSLTNNKSTGTYYQFYNDQKNLYIALKFTDDIYIKKVISGGLTLTINTNGRKNEKDAYQISLFPIEDYRTTRQFTSSPTKIDSTTQEHRKQALTKIKELKLAGFKEIPDSIISIYNTYGLKIKAKADEKGNLNYELSIPLEQLKLSLNKKTDIAINIKFNAVDVRSNKASSNNGGGGMARIGSNGGGNRNNAPKRSNNASQYGGGNRNSGGNTDILLFTTANDFWDKYKTQ